MTFAMPMAVFPAMAAQWSGSNAAGYFFFSDECGALSRRLQRLTRKVKRGAAVAIAAAVWARRSRCSVTRRLCPPRSRA
jgi:hypothetical protein